MCILLLLWGLNIYLMYDSHQIKKSLKSFTLTYSSSLFLGNGWKKYNWVRASRFWPKCRFKHHILHKRLFIWVPFLVQVLSAWTDENRDPNASNSGCWLFFYPLCYQAMQTQNITQAKQPTPINFFSLPCLRKGACLQGWLGGFSSSRFTFVKSE